MSNEHTDELNSIIQDKHFNKKSFTLSEIINSAITSTHLLMNYLNAHSPSEIGELQKYIDILRRLEQLTGPDQITPWKILSTPKKIKKLLDEFIEDVPEDSDAKLTMPPIKTQGEYYFALLLLSHLQCLTEYEDNIDYSEYSVPGGLINKVLNKLLFPKIQELEDHIEEYKKSQQTESIVTQSTEMIIFIYAHHSKKVTSSKARRQDVNSLLEDIDLDNLLSFGLNR